MASIDLKEGIKPNILCHYPACTAAVIGACILCQNQYCIRHIHMTRFGDTGNGVPAPLCYSCQEGIATQQKQRLRMDVAYASLLTVLLLTCAGTSFALHELRHLSAVLTIWMFWISVTGFIVALGRLVLKFMQLW